METSCDPSVVGAAGGGQPARARGIRAPYRLSGRLRGGAHAAARGLLWAAEVTRAPHWGMRARRHRGPCVLQRCADSAIARSGSRTRTRIASHRCGGYRIS